MDGAALAPGRFGIGGAALVGTNGVWKDGGWLGGGPGAGRADMGRAGGTRLGLELLCLSKKKVKFHLL